MQGCNVAKAITPKLDRALARQLLFICNMTSQNFDLFKDFSIGQSLLFQQMDPKVNHQDEKSKCLALQRIRARMIKGSFINEGSIDPQKFLAKKINKYTTLLSEKMLHKIKTEQLMEFAKDVQLYCKQSQKKNEQRKFKQTTFKQIDIARLLSDYKHSTKVRLLKINKKRIKTSQCYQLAIEPSRLPSPEHDLQNKVDSPLGNKKIRQAIEKNKKKIIPASRFRVNGKGFNSQIIQLLEKLDEIQSIQKLRKRQETMNEEEDEYLHDRSDHLKNEKQRLSTAFKKQERSKFKPMSRIKKDQKSSFDRNDFRIQELDYLKKVHDRSHKGKVLEPLKKSAIIISSNNVGKASIHLEEGLPKSIKSQIPYKIKRSEASISIYDTQRPQISNRQNITPPLFITNTNN